MRFTSGRLTFSARSQLLTYICLETQFTRFTGCHKGIDDARGSPNPCLACAHRLTAKLLVPVPWPLPFFNMTTTHPAMMLLTRHSAWPYVQLEQRACSLPSPGATGSQPTASVLHLSCPVFSAGMHLSRTKLGPHVNNTSATLIVSCPRPPHVKVPGPT